MSTDFNDLHVQLGLRAVRDQLLAGLAANDSPAPPDQQPLPDGPAPDDYETRPTLEQALARFVLAMPDAKVWDEHKKVLLKQTAAKALMGKPLFDEWMRHDERRTTEQQAVAPVAAAATAEGGGGLARALERFVYLYPTDNVWDRLKRERIPISALRYAIADCYDQWIKSPMRRELDVDCLVFDPTQQADPETTINTFRGLPLEPAFRDDKCEAIRSLIMHLCNDDTESFDWLCKWLAYPLQHVGAKMATAVLMHSHIQGSGKSLLFDEIVRSIYGEYGSTLGQHQLESQYTDWRSQLLFGLFEEIFSRDQKYSHTGTVKHMITGKSQRIEKKFISGWEEANHMNAVFLSNEVQPFPVEAPDRRMLVIWPQRKMSEELKAAVLAEIRDGGIEAFFGWLMKYPLRGFTTHTEPPMTPEKERLIDFGRPGWEVFYREWEGGYLDVPLMPCLTTDLFMLYRRWAERRREHVVSATRFGGFIVVQDGMTRKADVHYSTGGQSSRKGTFFIPRHADEQYLPREGDNQADWLGRCVQKFRSMLDTSDD